MVTIILKNDVGNTLQPNSDMVQLVDLETVLILSSHVIGKHKNIYFENPKQKI